MSLWIIIKNNLKLIFRNKALLALILLGPIILIAALSNAFDGLLSNNYEAENFTMGIQFDENSKLTSYKEQIIEVFKEQDIDCIEYKNEDAQKLIHSKTVDVFIDIKSNEYVVYNNSNEEIQAKICRYIMYQVIHQPIAANMKSITIKKQEIPYLKTVNATDYYGITEIVFFMWCATFLLSAVIQSERKNRIQQRFVISPVSKTTMYLGKFLPGTVATFWGMLICAGVATVLFDIHWGNITGTIGLLFIGSVASTALGLVCFYIVNNLAVSVVLEVMLIWTWGFIGGSFETYMLSDTPQRIKELSPIYFMNRTLIEYSSMGSSDYTGKCIIVLSIVAVIGTLIGILLMNRRMEDK